MGWLIQETRGQSLDSLRAQHEHDATRYSGGISGELVASDWHNGCVYMIIRLTYADDHPEKPGERVTFLACDLIQHTGNSFGAKSMEESVGPRMTAKPRREFAAKVYREIPTPPNEYARNFRDRAGIRYATEADARQTDLLDLLGGAAP